MAEKQILEPVYRDEDHELVGFIRQISADEWEPLTVFYYCFAAAAEKQDAIEAVLSNGMRLLTERWEYYSEEDNEWYRCIILEAAPDRVKVKEGIYGHGDGEVHFIEHPDKNKLRLAP